MPLIEGMQSSRGQSRTAQIINSSSSSSSSSLAKLSPLIAVSDNHQNQLNETNNNNHHNQSNHHDNHNNLTSPLSQPQLSKDETLALRKETIGSSVALFFQEDPLKIIRARGQWMYDESGVAYLDCINNVAHVGHCHPHVTRRAADQMATLVTNARYLHDNLVLYARRLLDTFPDPLAVAYFVNSGSEANDLALRLARSYTGGEELITLEGAYHGHLSSTIDISPYKFVKIGDGRPKDWVHVADMPCAYRGKYRTTTDTGDGNGTEIGRLYAADVSRLIDREITGRGRRLAGFIAESMISCGGQVPLPDGYLADVYKSVHEAGGVTIADEVQVGFGRTGNQMWAFQAQGPDVVPDIVTVGKSIGNGHPVACVITTRAISEAFSNIGTEYFNTYGGNPVSAAVAAAVLDVIEEERLPEHAVRVGDTILRRLRELARRFPVMGDIRGSGLFLGVDLVRDRLTREPNPEAASYAVRQFKRDRILMSTEGVHCNVLKFKPPMCFSLDDADQFLTSLERIMDDIQRQGIGMTGRVGPSVVTTDTTDTSESSSSGSSSASSSAASVTSEISISSEEEILSSSY